MFAKALLLFGLVCSCQCVDFIIKNKDRRPIWIGILSNPGKPILSNGGFILEARSKVTPKSWHLWQTKFLLHRLWLLPLTIGLAVSGVERGAIGRISTVKLVTVDVRWNAQGMEGLHQRHWSKSHWEAFVT